LTKSGRHHAGLARQPMLFRRRSGNECARGGIGVAQFQILQDCEVLHSHQSWSGGQCGLKGFSHDRIRKAPHNGRCGHPDGWSGHPRCAGLPGRAVTENHGRAIQGDPLRVARVLHKLTGATRYRHSGEANRVASRRTWRSKPPLPPIDPQPEIFEPGRPRRRSEIAGSNKFRTREHKTFDALNFLCV
jgi:hypothetical protein